jgi:uncharacterized phiE125 gp8 family phage protein
MRTTLQVVTAPVEEPVTVQIARRHCRIDQASEDSEIRGMLVSARRMAEGYLSRALLTQTLLWTVRPESMLHPESSRMRGTLQLPRAPVQSITSVIVTDIYGNVTTIEPATLPIPQNTPMQGYLADLDLEPATLRIGPETVLTDGTPFHWARLLHLQVTFVAGYATVAAIPESIRLGVLMMIAHLYEHRGDDDAPPSNAAERLLDLDRLIFLGGQ